MVKGGLVMENKLEWWYINFGAEAEYNGISYHIECIRSLHPSFHFVFRTLRQLYVTINGVTDHVTGGQSTYKLKRLAEKDLDRRLTLIN